MAVRDRKRDRRKSDEGKGAKIWRVRGKYEKWEGQKGWGMDKEEMKGKRDNERKRKKRDKDKKGRPRKG